MILRNYCYFVRCANSIVTLFKKSPDLVDINTEIGHLGFASELCRLESIWGYETKLAMSC